MWLWLRLSLCRLLELLAALELLRVKLAFPSCKSVFGLLDSLLVDVEVHILPHGLLRLDGIHEFVHLILLIASSHLVNFQNRKYRNIRILNFKEKNFESRA